jgi:hypothetical protein
VASQAKMQTDKAPLVVMALVMAALGLMLTVVFRSNTPRRPVIPTPMPSAVRPSATPVSVAVLLVGVNSFTSPSPALEALAVIQYPLSSNDYYLIGLSPEFVADPENPDPEQRSLRSVFAVDAQLGRGAMFTEDVVRRTAPGVASLDTEIDFDRATLADTIAQLGNITFRGEKLDGLTWQSRFDGLPPGATESRLKFQEDLFRSLLLGAQQQQWDMTRLAIALGRTFYPDMPSVVRLLNAAPPLAGAHITVTDAPLILPFVRAP